MLRNFCWVIVTTGLASLGLADTLNLKDGRTVNGTFLGGTAREIRMDLGDRIESFPVGRVASIQFESNQAAQAPPPAPAPVAPPPPPPREQTSNVFRPDNSSPASPSSGVELPAGASLVVRMIDSVDSERNRIGQTFRASLDEPVLVNGETAIPRGADVTVKLVDDKESGKITGSTVLTLDLVSVFVNG